MRPIRRRENGIVCSSQLPNLWEQLFSVRRSLYRPTSHCGAGRVYTTATTEHTGVHPSQTAA
ncbi:unnamed protein product, partial [Dicrocoelium dendriticum]